MADLTPGEAKALKALTYLYNRARRDDPALRYQIGEGTQVRYLCAQALAELTGRELKDVEAELSLPLVPRHHDPIPEFERLRFEVDLWRERADDETRAEVDALVEKWREHEIAAYREHQKCAGVLA